jgi:hypothetical protein
LSIEELLRAQETSFSREEWSAGEIRAAHRRRHFASAQHLGKVEEIHSYGSTNSYF